MLNNLKSFLPVSQTNKQEPKPNMKEEYVQYEKLQQKLNILESKIQNIKTNIEQPRQPEKS